MYRFDSAHERVTRDPQNDPRAQAQADGETVVERKPIVADRSQPESWPEVAGDRRRTERRRIERMGTDI